MGPLIGEQQQKALSPLPPPCHEAEKGLMTGKGPIAPSPVQRLVTHKDYAAEMVTSIIKETDLNPCGEHSSKDLGAFGLYNLSRLCPCHLHYTSKNSLDFYRHVLFQALAIRTHNQELTAKTKALAEETRELDEAEKAKTNLVMELVALREQMEKAKVDAMAEFQISQPFFNTCGIYYGDGFEDCLMQMRVAYPNLNLSQIVIDDIVPLTPEGDDTVSDEVVDSIHMVE
ncbi:hypothetical protein SO802_028431 [Lithocarpus litseifolius]|uniref:Uncharacterized protein n=1 Tax=Lithocarpus litseifolius TaxID=425828 RepID=A0AAW2BSI3_9ROSI